MLRFFRVRSWCLATALFLAMGTAGTSLDLLLHGDTSHHADPCVTAADIAHDAAAHHITTPSAERSDSSGTHCVACHLARAPRLRAESTALAHRPDEGRTFGVPTSIGVALAPALANIQPRSPPAA